MLAGQCPVLAPRVPSNTRALLFVQGSSGGRMFRRRLLPTRRRLCLRGLLNCWPPHLLCSRRGDGAAAGSAVPRGEQHPAAPCAQRRPGGGQVTQPHSAVAKPAAAQHLRLAQHVLARWRQRPCVNTQLAAKSFKLGPFHTRFLTCHVTCGRWAAGLFTWQLALLTMQQVQTGQHLIVL